MNTSGKYVYMKSKFPTNCVHISNLGRKCCAWLHRELVSELERFGKVTEFHFGEGSSSVAVFEDLESSIRFYEHCKPVHAETPVLIGGRQVKVEYSERKIRKDKNGDLEDLAKDKEFLKERGLVFVGNFVSEAESEELINWIDSQGLWEQNLTRRVQHYGYKFDYKNKTISSSWERDIPDIFARLTHRLLNQGLISEIPDQITINEYFADLYRNKTSILEDDLRELGRKVFIFQKTAYI
ncbi:alpha-ketoglutarate-dependent dioxygenase AlkB [Cryptosporidium felis]|nr:alpha-ketoglutarate-dependent dioxygenase AlkB [Cryptosporidium felis]